jgi:hypothetical protein
VTLVLHNAEFSSGRQPTRREDAWATARSPASQQADSQAPICCNDSLYRGPSRSGLVGWLVARRLPLDFPGESDTLGRLAHQERTCLPGNTAERPDRWRLGPVTAIRPTRSTGSPRKRDALALRDDNNQSVPSRLRYNAELSGERLPATREDAELSLCSPGDQP